MQNSQFRQKSWQIVSLMLLLLLLLSDLGASFSSSALAQRPARPPLSPSRQPLQTPPLTPPANSPLPANPSLNVDRPDAATAELSAISERFVDLIAAGDFEQAHQLLNPTLRQDWTAAQMQSNWESLQKVVGPYQKRGSIQVVDSNLVLVDLEFAKASDNLLILFDDQRQIQGVDFPLQLPRL